MTGRLLTLVLCLLAAPLHAGQLELTDGTVLQNLRLVGHTGDALVCRSGAEWLRIDARSIARWTPSAAWSDNRLDKALERARGLSRLRDAVAALEEALAHAPMGKARDKLVDALASTLVASGDLVGARRVLGRRRASPAANQLRQKAAEQVTALRDKLAKDEEPADQLQTLAKLLPLAHIDGAGMGAEDVVRRWRGVISARQRHWSDHPLQACGKCEGATGYTCQACAGKGQVKKYKKVFIAGGRGGTRLVPYMADCRTCKAGAVTCSRCYGTGVGDDDAHPHWLRHRVNSIRGRVRSLGGRGGQVAAVVLAGRQFIPVGAPESGATGPGETATQAALIRQGLKWARYFDILSHVAPIADAKNLPRADFSRDRADLVIDPVDLASNPRRYEGEWISTLVRVQGVRDRRTAPYILKVLDVDAPLLVTVPTEAMRDGFEQSLGDLMKYGGRAGDALQRWYTSYPFDAVSAQLGALQPGWFILYGRLQPPPDGRADRLTLFEVWSFEPVLGVTAGARPTPQPETELPEIPAPSGTVGQRVHRADELYAAATDHRAADRLDQARAYAIAAQDWYRSALAQAPDNRYIADQVRELDALITRLR